MKRLLLISIWLITLAKYAGAQEQLSIKQQADRLFERYEYFKSLNLYLEVADKNNAQVTERIADCYREINQYEDAEEWYAKVIDEPKANSIDRYYYAEALLRNQKFDQAKEQYKIYFTNDPAELRLKISSCDSAVLWMKQSKHYIIKNASNFNTQYSDWALSYNGNSGFIFTSDRITDDRKTDQRTGNNWFKLYQTNVKGSEVSELPVSNKTNKDIEKYHIGPMALNTTADTAYITITTDVQAKKIDLDKQSKKSTQRLYTRRLQLVMANKVNGEWVVFGNFPYNDIQKYSIGNAALSKDGRVIYFSSDMQGGEGKTDIWYCEKQADGSWGKPINCGKTINTKDEDSFPYLDDGGTLYYSSKGHIGMGGYDIYSAKGEKANWSVPQNLKYPINTTSDDFCLITHDGTTGYFSSNRNGGQGSDDIYGFAINPNDTVPSKHIVENNTPKPIPENPSQFKPGFVLNTIYYDLDKSNIRPDGAIELDKLIVILNQNPSLKINIASYTDSRASYPYNLALSRRRAKAATDYLVAKGIAADRLFIKWYGKNNLVNKCADGINCTEAEHQLNRRTEFSVK
jgi:outer membrane protein OmpA-like peptidoglycan-associated protein